MGPLGDVDYEMAAQVNIANILYTFSIKFNKSIVYFQFTQLIYKYTMLLFTLFN